MARNLMDSAKDIVKAKAKKKFKKFFITILGPKLLLLMVIFAVFGGVANVATDLWGKVAALFEKDGVNIEESALTDEEALLAVIDKGHYETEVIDGVEVTNFVYEITDEELGNSNLTRADFKKFLEAVKKAKDGQRQTITYKGIKQQTITAQCRAKISSSITTPTAPTTPGSSIPSNGTSGTGTSDAPLSILDPSSPTPVTPPPLIEYEWYWPDSSSDSSWTTSYVECSKDFNSTEIESEYLPDWREIYLLYNMAAWSEQKSWETDITNVNKGNFDKLVVNKRLDEELLNKIIDMFIYDCSYYWDGARTSKKDYTFDELKSQASYWVVKDESTLTPESQGIAPADGASYTRQVILEPISSPDCFWNAWDNLKFSACGLDSSGNAVPGTSGRYLSYYTRWTQIDRFYTDAKAYASQFDWKWMTEQITTMYSESLLKYGPDSRFTKSAKALSEKYDYYYEQFKSHTTEWQTGGTNNAGENILLPKWGQSSLAELPGVYMSYLPEGIATADNEGYVKSNIEVDSALFSNALWGKDLTLARRDDLTVDEFNQLTTRYMTSKGINLNLSKIYNQGAAYVGIQDADSSRPISCLALFALSAQESGYGTSKIGLMKNNFFGWGAVDSNPFNGAYSYSSPYEGIISVGAGIRNNYTYGNHGVNPVGGPQDTFYKMRMNGGVHEYCTDAFSTWGGNAIKIRQDLMKLAVEMGFDLGYSVEEAMLNDMSAVVQYACSWVGVCPYVWGGETLSANGGVDCSGFTQQVYAQFGVTLPRTADEQFRHGGGTFINSIDLLQPGDLVFFGIFGHSGHVGIYIGDGKYVHASSEKTGIKISVLANRNDFIGGRRIAYSSN